MIYSSWDTECDRLKLIIMGHFFCSFTPPKAQKNQSFEKNEKHYWKYYHFACVTKTTILWGMVPEI